MADIIGNGIPKPCILFGRSTSGVLSAVTTDGNGNLNVTGSTSTVDTIGNSIATPVQIFGRTSNGVLQAVTTDGNGNLN
jgi:hypothetical protein